jgi:hypothetical protein
MLVPRPFGGGSFSGPDAGRSAAQGRRRTGCGRDNRQNRNGDAVIKAGNCLRRNRLKQTATEDEKDVPKSAHL